MTFAVDLPTAVAALEARRSRLGSERAAVSLDALSGDDAAAERLREVETEIAQVERDLELHALAAREKERREREAAEKAERDRRARAEAEADRLNAKRDTALRAVQAELVGLGQAVRTFLGVDSALESASDAAGRRYRSLAETIAELSVIALRDAGLTADLPYVYAAHRARLLELYPLPEPLDHALAREGVSVDPPSRERHSRARCSVCTHPHHSEIEAQLAAGTSYREVESVFGVSRSALARHTRRHLTE